MTFTIRLPAFVGAMAAAFCLATLAITASNEAAAQVIVVPGSTYSYYNGYGPVYSSAFGPAYTSGYGYRRYTGYGYGPYVYGSSSAYGYPSSGGYVYPRFTSNRVFHSGLRLHGGAYQPIYIPNNTMYYSPYGFGYRGF